MFPVIYEPEEDEVLRRYVELEQARRYLEAEEDRGLYQADHGQCSCHLQPAQTQLPPPPPFQHIRYRVIVQYVTSCHFSLCFRDAVLVARNWKHAELETGTNC